MKHKIDPFMSVANIFCFHFVRYLTATTLTEMKLWVTLSTHPSQHALYKFVWKPGKDISACVPSFMDVLKVCGTCGRYTELIWLTIARPFLLSFTRYQDTFFWWYGLFPFNFYFPKYIPIKIPSGFSNFYPKRFPENKATSVLNSPNLFKI